MGGTSIEWDETAWREAVDRVLAGKDFERTLVTRTHDHIAIRPLYPAAEAVSPLRRLDGGSRTIRIHQRLDHSSPAAARDLALAELDGGAEGLVLTLRGAPSARGFGLDPAALDAMLDAVPIDRVALRLEGSPFAGEASADAVLNVIERRGSDPAALDLDLGIDPIGDMARCGEAPQPWQKLASGLAGLHRRWREMGVPGPVIRADGRPHHEAGASEAQELAGVLATAVAYLRTLDAGGIGLEPARAGVSFLLVADADLLLSVCKFRALRHLWARVETACGLEPAPIRLHGETAWRMLTRRDPHGNLLRGTLAATAAILGGVDGLTVLPFTSALGLPDAAARRLARNTALILRDEAHLAKVADPVAGAGAFEALTQGLCEEAWMLFQDLERGGGIVAALETGNWQAKVGAMRAKRCEDVTRGAAPIIGTTLFPDPAEATPTVRHTTPASPRTASAEFEPLPSLRDAEPFETAAEMQEPSP
ncbi:MAG TPA: methylmalonyl-CoA mutase family protein [Lichenihabitans sp.]|nr:methylmalonyl-CoA mutase family protein [Lichenihabitans sp.]